MNKTVRVLIILLLIICIGVFIFAGYKLLSKHFEYKEAENFYNDLSNQFTSKTDKTETPVSTPASDEVILDDEVSPITTDWDSLLKQYPDIVGWIYLPDTVLNYPVAQYDDNSYYLNRQLNGSYNSSGTLFVEVLNQKDFSDPNTIIYGHHMNDGSMFTKLIDYSYQSFYDEHPVMYLNTPKYNYRIEVFAGYVTKADSDTYRISFVDDDDFNKWVAEVKAQSKFECDVEVNPGDKIVTMSTCTYEYDDARFVLQGKLVPIH